MSSGQVRFGTCGWADATLVACGRFYPPGVAHDARKRLAFYATRFDVVEIDATYYALPPEASPALWAEATPAGFTFDVKAYALQTGHAAAARTLPKDLRAALPAELRESPRLDARALDPGFLRAVDERFVSLLAPLERAGKLGVLLFQYGPWFGPTRASRDVIAGLRARLGDRDVAVEFRNGAWLRGAARDETLALLRDHGLDYVSVDEPQGFPSSVPPEAHVTGRTAIARFHGRNRATWAVRNASAADRMNWDYADAELAEWVPRVRAMSDAAREVHVLMNNCHEEKAVRSATRMRELCAPPFDGRATAGRDADDGGA